MWLDSVHGRLLCAPHYRERDFLRMHTRHSFVEQQMCVFSMIRKKWRLKNIRLSPVDFALSSAAVASLLATEVGEKILWDNETGSLYLNNFGLARSGTYLMQVGAVPIAWASYSRMPRGGFQGHARVTEGGRGDVQEISWDEEDEKTPSWSSFLKWAFL